MPRLRGSDAGSFYEQPILNSPYEPPSRHHPLDEHGQPLELPPVEGRRPSKFIVPIPKSRKRKAPTQGTLDLESYTDNALINEIRLHVDAWRSIPNPAGWGVTAASAAFGRAFAAQVAQVGSGGTQCARVLGALPPSEWTQVIDAWGVGSSDEYRHVQRMGRRSRLGPNPRERLWPVFESLRTALAEEGFTTWAAVMTELAQTYATKSEKPFDHILIDEAQDLGPAELRFFAAIAPAHGRALA